MAEVNKDGHEKHLWNNLSCDTNNIGFNVEFIKQFPEEIETVVTKDIARDMSNSNSGKLGALSTLDGFLLYIQLHV